MATGSDPGWYPDPNDDSGARYWDGSAWTDRTRPRDARPPAGGSSRSRRTPLLLVGTVALLALGAGVAFLLTRDGEDGEEVIQAAGSDSRTTETTSETTTTTGSTTTTTPAATTEPAGAADLGNPVPPDVLALAQELADAISRHDWDAVRALEPRFAADSDAELAEGFGDVHLDVVVPVSFSGSRLRLGLVAQQETPLGRATTVTCMTWSVDPAARVIAQNAGDADEIVSEPGRWIPPEELESMILSECPGDPAPG